MKRKFRFISTLVAGLLVLVIMVGVSVGICRVAEVENRTYILQGTLSPGSNLLQNPGFEDGFAHWDTEIVEGEAEFYFGSGRSGGYSGGIHVLDGGFGSYSQTIPVTGGCKIHAEVWAILSSGNDNTYAYLGVWTYDENWNILDNKEETTTSDEWTKLSLDLTTDSSAAYAVIFLDADAYPDGKQDYVRFDDAYLSVDAFVITPKILIINDEGIDSPEYPPEGLNTTDVPFASDVNKNIDKDPGYLNQYEGIIYCDYSWNNTLSEDAKSKINSFAQVKPTGIYIYQAGNVTIPLFESTSSCSNKELKFSNLPDLSNINLPSPSDMKIPITTTKTNWNNIVEQGGIKIGETLVGAVYLDADTIFVARDFSENGLIWGMISLVNSVSGKAFVISLPYCAATEWAAGGVCYVTAGTGLAYIVTSIAQIMADTQEAIIEHVNISDIEASMDLHYRCLNLPGEISINNIYYEYDEESGYYFLKCPSDTEIYSHGDSLIKATSDTYLALDNDYFYGYGLCNYPCATITNFVDFQYDVDRDFHLTPRDDFPVLQDNYQRTYTFSDPETLILNDDGLCGTGCLQPHGNKTNFIADNDDNVYASEPTVTYSSLQPTNVQIGKEATISVEIKNTGSKNIQGLWLGLDIHDPERNKVENTKTPIADEPPPHGTGKVGLIDFSNQGLQLSPGDSRIFTASYTFDTSVTGHEYTEGTYEYRYRAWMYDYPGQEGAIPLSNLQTIDDYTAKSLS